MEEKKCVLIIEDDLMLLEMYKDKLKSSGFRVFTASDGKKGIQRIKQGGMDLILLDILMPGLNGFEVLKKLKSEKTTSNIPVVVLTNVGSASIDNDKKLALSLGASDYLVKSLNTPNDVVSKIKELI